MGDVIKNHLENYFLGFTFKPHTSQMSKKMCDSNMKERKPLCVKSSITQKSSSNSHMYSLEPTLDTSSQFECQSLSRTNEERKKYKISLRSILYQPNNKIKKTHIHIYRNLIPRVGPNLIGNLSGKIYVHQLTLFPIKLKERRQQKTEEPKRKT